MSAAIPVAHLLVVSAHSEVHDLLQEQLQGELQDGGRRYRIHHAAARGDVFASLAHRRIDCIVIDQAGLPRLSLKEALAGVHQADPGKPVVVLGERAVDRPALRLLHRGSIEYLGMEELERLPQVLERLLSGQIEGNSAVAFQDQGQNDAGRMHESQRLISIGRLVGSIAHEINNPLEAVANLLFLIEREPGMPAASRGYLTMAQGELNRAIQISKQTLNFYRESSEPVPVRMGSLLDDVLVLHGHRIAAKRLRVVRQYRADDPINVFPGAMRQIFSNLIGNAIEASSENGSLCLRVRNSRMRRGSGVTGLRILIGDTGTGMSAEVRRRVGEPLFTTKGQQGTGLGLWVTRSIVEGYGGELALRSSTGKNHGSVFSIFLPTDLRPRSLTRPGAPAVADPDRSPTSGPPASGKQRRDASSEDAAAPRSA
jgi:signal transduction histidine kinase